MTKDEALKLAHQALEANYQLINGTDTNGGLVYCIDGYYSDCFDEDPINEQTEEAITAIKEALAQPEQEPVAWLITDKNINSLQIESIQRLIDRAKHAHMTDIKLRINGQDEWHQADWLKHLTRTTPPQRTWEGLTDEEIEELFQSAAGADEGTVSRFARAIEAKLKERNT